MVVAEDLQCLKVIALQRGCKGPVWVSSQTLGKSLGISPQTASRRLISLERQNAITRTVRPDGQYVTIMKTGEAELRREYADYCRIFGAAQEHYVLAGTLISGLGEGRYYMSRPQYCRQFSEALGFEPYPGTLNLRLNPPCIEVRKTLDGAGWIQIHGFSADNRTFGDVRCLPCTIDGVSCAIVVPVRSHYPEDIVEIIAPVALRERIGLEDGDEVEVGVSYD